MIKESDLKYYFEGNISVEVLIDKIQSKDIERIIPESPNPQNSPRTTKITYDQEFHDLMINSFVLTKNHLIMLCDDFLAEKITSWNLEDIALILYACEGIVWGKDEEERKLIANTMFHFSSSEINCPLTKDYIKDVKDSIENK